MKIIATENYKKIYGAVSFKHKCDECGEFTYLTRKDMRNKSIPRCRFCGSTWLEPVTEHAKDKMLQLYDVYKNDVRLNSDKKYLRPMDEDSNILNNTV